MFSFRIMVPLIFISMINTVTDNIIEQSCCHFQDNFHLIFSLTFDVRWVRLVSSVLFIYRSWRTEDLQLASSDQEHSVTCNTIYHLSLDTDWCLEPLEDERRESSFSQNGFWNLHFDHLDSCSASHFFYFLHKQQLWGHVNI